MPSQVLSIDVDPPAFATNIVLRAEGNSASIVQMVGGRTITIDIVGDPGMVATTQEDGRSGSVRIHLEGAPSAALGMSLRVTGLDPATAPVGFDDIDLLRRHHVTYVYTWRTSLLVPLFDGRPCFERAMENREVVVFGVRESCRGTDPGAGS